MFRPAYWGRGYATEALKGFLNFYWKTFPDGHPTIAEAEERKFLEAVTGPAEEAPQNRASIGVLKKCGFEFWTVKAEENSERPEQRTFLSVWRKRGPGHRS